MKAESLCRGHFPDPNYKRLRRLPATLYRDRKRQWTNFWMQNLFTRLETKVRRSYSAALSIEKNFPTCLFATGKWLKIIAFFLVW